jgi:PPM family protein phosphatase
MTHRPPLAIQYAQRSDPGRRRRANEDTSAIQTVAIDGQRAVIAVIADGMGGARAGAEASQLAVRTALDLIAARLNDGVPASEPAWADLLGDALRRANEAVHRRSRSATRLNGMGTTLLASVVWDRRVRIAHIGDSRAYVVRPAVRRPQIIQLTDDHTVVAEMIHQGAITPADAEAHPQRHQLARSLGVEPEIEPEFVARTLRNGERVLLCSDGLPLHVSDAELARAVSDAPTPQEACDRLVDLANQRGGRDNVTVVVLAAERDDSAAA